jgi:hypothetical protein
MKKISNKKKKKTEQTKKKKKKEKEKEKEKKKKKHRIFLGTNWQTQWTNRRTDKWSLNKLCQW